MSSSRRNNSAPSRSSDASERKSHRHTSSGGPPPNLQALPRLCLQISRQLHWTLWDFPESGSPTPIPGSAPTRPSSSSGASNSERQGHPTLLNGVHMDHKTRPSGLPCAESFSTVEATADDLRARFGSMWLDAQCLRAQCKIG